MEALIYMHLFSYNVIIPATLRPLENSTISSAWIFLRPYTRAIPSPIDSTRPVSSRSVDDALPKIRSSKIDETSADPTQLSKIGKFFN